MSDLDGFRFGAARDSLNPDEGEFARSAERVAHDLIEQNPNFVHEQSVWTIPDDTIEIRQALLGWQGTQESQDDPIDKRVAYANAYLDRVRRGVL